MPVPPVVLPAVVAALLATQRAARRLLLGNFSQPRVQDTKAALQQLDSGDVLLYRMVPAAWNTARLLFDTTAWDHCSLVVRQRGERALEPSAAPLPPEAPPDFRWEPSYDGQLQIFEANREGVYAYPLEQFFEVFGGKFRYIAFRQLNTREGLRGALSEGQCAALENFVREVWSRPYEPHLLGELLRAVVVNPDIEDLADKSKENLEGLFCSELVAEAYQRLGLIPNCTLNSNEVLPSAFAGPRHTEASGVIDELMLRSPRRSLGLALGPEQLLKWPGKSLNI